MNPEQTNNTVPDTTNLPDEEMKMPASAPTDAPHSSLGVILGVIIVVLLLILAGLYLWGTTLQQSPTPTPAAVERPTDAENNEPESTNAEADVTTSQAISSSDELSAIEADFESTENSNFEEDFAAIEAEFQAAEAE